MTDVNTIASRYIDLWNERAPGRRREMLAANWTSDAKYIDPLMSGDGHDGVDALIAGVQQRFPAMPGQPCPLRPQSALSFGGIGFFSLAVRQFTSGA
jgi:hypothetical protein